MPPDIAEAPSTASTNNVDAKSNESDGLSLGQAAAKLFAQSQSREKAKTEKAAEATTPETSPEEPEQTPEPAAESEAETAEKPNEEAEVAEETTADQDSEESEDVLSNRSTLDEKTKQRIQKRIDKEVGKRKALETRLKEVESILQEKDAQPQTPATVIAASDLPPNIAAISDLNGVEKLRKEAKDAVRWAETMLDAEADGELPTEVANQGWDKKKLKEAIRNAKVALEDHIPQRENFLRQRQQFQAAARKEFPYLTDRSSPDYVAIQNAYRNIPWLNQAANGDYLAALMLEGNKALAARKQAEADKAKAKTAPAKPKVAVKPSSDQTAVSSTGSTSRVSTTTAQKANVSAERAKIEAKGHVTAQEAAALLLHSDKLRNSR